MAIYLRGKSYYYDFVYKGQRYTGCIGPVSKTVAKEEEARVKAKVIEGILNPAKARKSPRFDEFIKDYCEYLQTNRSPRTCDRMQGIARHLIAFFGTKRLNELSGWDFERYKKARKEANAKPTTINTELSMLKALLNKAHALGKLAESPAKAVKMFPKGKGRTRILSDDEEARILAACSPALRRVVEAGLLTGFRRRELACLRPQDVDFEKETVTIDTAYAKSRKPRTLPLTESLKAVLADAIAHNGGAATVFVNEQGKPWEVTHLSTAFGRACRKAGIERLGPHVLRHTFATRLTMGGVDLQTVQELLGHADIAMTVRYAHPTTDHKRQALALLEKRFSSGESQQNSQHPPLSAQERAKKIVSIR